MKTSVLTIFAAWYGDDPSIGGLINALKRQQIETLVVPRAQWPSKWTPSWVDDSAVKYFVLVKWSDDARFITHRDCPLAEWLRDKKIALLPSKPWWKWWVGNWVQIS